MICSPSEAAIVEIVTFPSCAGTEDGSYTQDDS